MAERIKAGGRELTLLSDDELAGFIARLKRDDLLQCWSRAREAVRMLERVSRCHAVRICPVEPPYNAYTAPQARELAVYYRRVREKAREALKTRYGWSTIDDPVSGPDGS